jgi:glycosyltransferase involved in cell wall biosynthesis
MNTINQPLVSIVIPVYNGSNYLAEAIDSALAQTYPHCEVVVINDGSTDGGATEAVALQYGDRIRYFSKENGGVASALNKGIEMMRGEYFSWLSHDDLYTPDKVANAVEALQTVPDPLRTIVVCDLDLIDAAGKLIYRPVRKSVSGLFSGREVFLKYLKGLSFGGCNLLINKELFVQYGKFENLKTAQDMECWTRFMLHGCSYLFIRSRDVKSRIHSEQDTQRLSHVFSEDKNRLGKMIAALMSKLNADKTLWKALVRNQLMEGNSDALRFIRKTSGNSYCLQRLTFGPYYAIYRLLKKLYYWLFIFKKWAK